MLIKCLCLYLHKVSPYTGIKERASQTAGTPEAAQGGKEKEGGRAQDALGTPSGNIRSVWSRPPQTSQGGFQEDWAPPETPFPPPPGLECYCLRRDLDLPENLELEEEV